MRRPFIGDRRGAVFVIFSLLLPVVLTGILGLMSLSGLTSARADLQAASNAAANAIVADLNSALQVSATPDALVTDFDKQKRAEMVVQSLLGSRRDLNSLATVVTTDPETITVNVSADIDNSTAGFLWTPFVSSSAKTTISWNKADQLQIALAIDAGSDVASDPFVQKRMAVLKAALISVMNKLSVLSNYPDVAVSVVPFSAQIATDSGSIALKTTDASGRFYDQLLSQFADAQDELQSLIVPSAHADVTACYNAPLVPQGVDGSAFGGTSAPMQNPCETSLPRIRGMAKISKPVVDGKPVWREPTNSPAYLKRKDMIDAINAISPAGCRNLAMGVTWSLAQFPMDKNPKVIFLIANGQNSKNAKAATSECTNGADASGSVKGRLDREFVSACEMVRDPARNKGRKLDLLVLQAVDGNPVALKSCASETGGVVNYFTASSTDALGALFETSFDRLVKVAQGQRQKHRKSGRKKTSFHEDDDD